MIKVPFLEKSVDGRLHVIDRDPSYDDQPRFRNAHFTRLPNFPLGPYRTASTSLKLSWVKKNFKA